MRILTLALFLMVSCFTFGQGQHELKLNILSTLDKQPQLQYEYLKGEKLGLEFVAGYLKRGLIVGKVGTAPLLDFQSFPLHFMVTGAAVKYYFEPNSNGRGAYLGAYTRAELKVAEKEGYETAFREIFGQEPIIENDHRLNIGLSTGYKWLISDHWIIEPQVRWGWNAVKPSLTQEWQAEIFLSLGYRF